MPANGSLVVTPDCLEICLPLHHLKRLSANRSATHIKASSPACDGSVGLTHCSLSQWVLSVNRAHTLFFRSRAADPHAELSYLSFSREFFESSCSPFCFSLFICVWIFCLHIHLCTHLHIVPVECKRCMLDHLELELPMICELPCGY